MEVEGNQAASEQGSDREGLAESEGPHLPQPELAAQHPEKQAGKKGQG